MDLGLSGKNVFVTGGSKGIGRAIALTFAAEGANIATCARSAEPLREVADAIRAKNVDAFVETCDVGDAAAPADFLSASRQHLGGIDVLVNNVSALSVTDDPEAWQASINVDLQGTVRASEQVIPWMAESGGSIEFEGGARARMKSENPDFYNLVLGSIPWGWMGRPEEVADAALFLASSRASWVTGACLAADGGQHRGNR